MVDYVKLEELVRAKAAAAGDRKVLDLSSDELREFLVQCIRDRARLENQKNKKGEY